MIQRQICRHMTGRQTDRDLYEVANSLFLVSTVLYSMRFVLSRNVSLEVEAIVDDHTGHLPPPIFVFF